MANGDEPLAKWQAMQSRASCAPTHAIGLWAHNDVEAIARREDKYRDQKEQRRKADATAAAGDDYSPTHAIGLWTADVIAEAEADATPTHTHAADESSVPDDQRWPSDTVREFWDPNAWLEEDVWPRRPPPPSTPPRRTTTITGVGLEIVEEGGVWFRAANGAHYRINSSWDLTFNRRPARDSDLADTGPSGTKKERDQLNQLISMLNAGEKSVVATSSIRLWREIQIWMALEGAFTGYPWTYTQIIDENNLMTMIMDRPGLQLARYHQDESTVPKEYVGMVCIAGKWFHEC